MRRNVAFPKLMAALLIAAALLAKSDSSSGPAPTIQVLSANCRIEITGGDQLQVNESSRTLIRREQGRIIIDATADDHGDAIILQVPRRSNLDVSTSNGAIRISGVTGPLVLNTSNGAITAQDAGMSPVRAVTSNGRIEIALLRGTNANLSARTTGRRDLLRPRPGNRSPYHQFSRR